MSLATRIIVTAAVLAVVSPGAAHADAAPASPVEVRSSNGSSSISLSWAEPATGTRAVAFRVYEGATVVARNTTTHVTVERLGFASTHTFTITAVDAAGRESAPSAPVTRRVWMGGAIPPCQALLPTGLAVTAVTGSAVSLAWTPSEALMAPASVQVYEGARAVADSIGRTAHVSGLAPASTHTYRIGGSCFGQLVFGPPVTVTTAAGPAQRPDPVTALAVTATSPRTVTLTWSSSGSAARYAVYDGATAVAVTAAAPVTIRNLYRDTAHVYTVVARTGAGDESTGTSVRASTVTCEAAPPRPVVTATAVSPSTVVLTWAEDSAATLFTVSDSGITVATSATPSAVVSGLGSASAHHFTVTAALAGGCGQTPASAPVAVTTPPGPSSRPLAPQQFTFLTGHAIDLATSSVTLGWTQPATGPAVAGYRVYEGGTLVGTSAASPITLTLPSAATHRYTVAAVDAAGDESPQSAPLTFSSPWIPVP
ncbi:MAG: Conserved putative secreted protein [Actinomycetia bacterium]|nr:Conserved putative secreted protein [Actinomycetes bacterium]